MESSIVNRATQSTKTLFELIITYYDSLASAYHKQYGGYIPRVLIDFERGRFLTWGEVLGFSSYPNGGDKCIGEESDVDFDLLQELVLGVKDDLDSVSSLNRKIH